MTCSAIKAWRKEDKEYKRYIYDYGIDLPKQILGYSVPASQEVPVHLATNGNSELTPFLLCLCAQLFLLQVSCPYLHP